MANGWIKLHRKLLESLIFGNEKGLKVWLWCLLKANHAEKEVLFGRKKITIKSGQFIMGSTTAKEQLSLAKATIWYWLNFLEKEGQVVLNRTTKYTIVTIPKWEEYQHDLDTNETPSGRWVGTNKNEENVKKTSGAVAPQVIEVQEMEVSAPVRQNKNTPEMLRGYEIFNDNPARATFHMKEIERESIKVLLETYGHDELVNRYAIIRSHRGEKGCPEIHSPSSMLEKMPKMEYFLTNV